VLAVIRVWRHDYDKGGDACSTLSACPRSEECARRVQDDYAKWVRIRKETGIRLE